jgi:hypothetical protein
MVDIKTNGLSELTFPIHNLGIMLLDYYLELTEMKTAYCIRVRQAMPYLLLNQKTEYCVIKSPLFNLYLDAVSPKMDFWNKIN